MINSGRTTRMLNEAIEHAREGRRVHVVCVRAMINYLADWVRTGNPKERYVVSPGVVEFVSGGAVNFHPPIGMDWVKMRLPTVPTDEVLLVDHYAIEQTCEKLLEMLYRYDDEDPEKFTERMLRARIRRASYDEPSVNCSPDPA